MLVLMEAAAGGACVPGTELASGIAPVAPSPPEAAGFPPDGTSALNAAPPVAALAVAMPAAANGALPGGATIFRSGISFLSPQNAAVTAAPNPQTLTTPRAINPKTGTM